MAGLHVAVIFGGRSGEHEVSIVSAESVMTHLDDEKYDVLPIGIGKDGRWLVGGDVLDALKSGDASSLSEVTLLPGSPWGRLAVLDQNDGEMKVSALSRIDLAFPVLHGPFGEDGTVQGLLELCGIPYVGCGVLASAVGMDKAIMKTVWQAHGLPVVEYIVVRRGDLESDVPAIQRRVEQVFGYPCFVKPANLGSSVGVSKVHSQAELHEALGLAASYDSKLLIERAVDGRELECSVLGNERPRASVVGEIVPAHEFYDYEAKYVDEGSQLFIPADLDEETSDRVRQLATSAFDAVDCTGMARVDLFLERATGRLYLNEINTIPGFTSISMYPKLWEASGLPYGELLDELVQLGLRRHAERSRNRIDYRAP